MQIVQHVPCIAVIGALLFLAWGLVRHSLDITIASLTAVVLTGVIALPIFLNAPRTNESGAAMVALEATAAVALAALFTWRTTRRYPLFPAAAVLLIGIAASVLVLRAAM